MKRSLLLLSLCSAGFLHAEVKLPAIFADHLVLQRGKPVAIWGTAAEGEEVTVKFGEQSKKSKAGKDGSWKVTLEALKASSEPAELSIKGTNEIVLKDVLVGEVWVCSGQSNMGFVVKSVIDAEAEIAAANDPQLRMFHVPNAVADEPQKDLVKKDATSAWQESNPTNVGAFTAAGYFFGRELRKQLNVPVGLINTSWGGTRAEAWTSKPALEAVPTCKAIITGWDENLKTYDPVKSKEQYDKTVEAVKAKIAAIKVENAQPGATPKVLPPAPRPWENQLSSQHRPAVLFNAMISPLVPYTIKGAIWYQGESNQGRAEQYLTLMPTLIKDWRKQWGDEISFYQVQLASYGNNKPSWPQPVGAADTWAELQWTQMQTALTLPKCGMAVANDIGEEKDIHPKNKQEVGRRLALQALVKDYKKTDYMPNGISGGPIYGGGDVSGNKYQISWSNVGGGLKTRDGGELTGFIIAGEDKVWKPAKAKIVGKQVQVWSSEVAVPVAVRYAWSSWCPEANLINAEGLPASLFRTDKWELSTKGNENPFAPPAVKAPAAPKTEAKPAEPVKKAA
ncbi:sialate O-acetylesterase [soil metagenome]